MNDLVKFSDGVVFAESQNVADKFNKAHRTIVRKIEQMFDSSPEFSDANFGVTEYTTSQNKVHKCYSMTRDGFCMIAMSLTGRDAEEWKIKYINAFNMMEDSLKEMPVTMQTINEIVKKAESDKSIASACGAQLARYRKIKKENSEKLSLAMSEVQNNLGF